MNRINEHLTQAELKDLIIGGEIDNEMILTIKSKDRHYPIKSTHYIDSVSRLKYSLFGHELNTLFKQNPKISKEDISKINEKYNLWIEDFIIDMILEDLGKENNEVKCRINDMRFVLLPV